MLDSIEAAIEDIKAGKMIIVVDDENRENEGDLLMAADHVTGEAINFMAHYGCGLICLPMERSDLKRLGLPLMVTENTDTFKTAFTVTIDEVSCHTGISAFERAKTIRRAVDPTSGPMDFNRPGHVFPLEAKEGGVLSRNGHTEAAVDLARLAGCRPCGVICEIMKADGTMARLPELKVFAKEHDLKIISIEDLIRYRQRQIGEYEFIDEAILPTRFGEFRLLGFENKDQTSHHLALVKGNIKDQENVLVRIHSECLTGDAFHSLRCDCGSQLEKSLELIEREGQGALIYLRQEGRGIGLINKIRAYHLQEQGLDTVDANVALGFAPDLRDYYGAGQILDSLGVKSLRLLTNNPDKVSGLEKAGVKVNGRVPLEISHDKENNNYLKTKRDRMGHLLTQAFEENQKEEAANPGQVLLEANLPKIG